MRDCPTFPGLVGGWLTNYDDTLANHHCEGACSALAACAG